MGSSLRRLAGLLAATVMLPLAVAALGFWERERGVADLVEFDRERVRLAQIVEAIEARAPPDGRPDYGIQFRRGGQLYGGPYALTKAREARDEVAWLAAIMRWRRALPPVVIGAAEFAAGLSALVLLVGAVLGRLGRTSREVLVRGFAAVRRVLPGLLAAQVVLGAAALTAAALFEAAAFVQPGLGSGEVKLLFFAGAAVLGVLFTAGTALAGLRRALRAFEPDPLPVLGRPVSPAEAPGLWRLVDGLADRLGALKPDAIVVGLTEGFFVSAGPKVLEPSGERLAGRTLYVPLPYLPFLRADEMVSIIGHELAHFAGGDTAYSQRFLPIYAGVERSLDAVATAGGAGFGILAPTLRLGLFVMDRFHHAVRHWSRAREFAADATGAGPTSPGSAARALLRTGPVGARIAETLNAAAEQPDAAPDDLVAAVLDRAIARGLGDPAVHLEAGQAHPNDTHPPTRERVARLGADLTPELLAGARAVPPREALGALGVYFADPSSLCRAASADFLGAVRQHDAAVHAHLVATAAEVEDEERVLHGNTRPGAIFLVAAGLVFVLAGVALAGLGLPGLSWGEARLVAGIAGAGGIIFVGSGAWRLRRGERVVLTLRPEALTAPGLDRPIAWDVIADLDMTWHNTRMVTRVLLPPDGPFPAKVPGARGVKLDAKRGIVTLTHGLPRKMEPQDFADLIGRYRAAAQARRLLAESAAGNAAANTTSHTAAEVP